MDVPAPASCAEPGSGDAVKAVSVIGTGTVRIRPEHLVRTAYVGSDPDFAPSAGDCE